MSPGERFSVLHKHKCRVLIVLPVHTAKLREASVTVSKAAGLLGEQAASGVSGGCGSPFGARGGVSSFGHGLFWQRVR